MSNDSLADIHWNANAKTDSSSIIRVGFWSVGVMMLVFLLWSVLFPLSSAVITPGTFMSKGKNKVIQHSAGGRVRDIFVTEGAKLAEGDPVIELDKTQSQAELTRLDARYASLTALKSRLDAERSYGLRKMPPPRLKTKLKLDGFKLRGVGNLSKIGKAGSHSLRGVAGDPMFVGWDLKVSEDLDPMSVSAVAELAVTDANEELIESQRDAYHSGRKLLAQEIEGLTKKAGTLGKQRDGLLARIGAQKSLLAMSRREFRRLKPLARQGYVARNRLNDRERSILELEGTISSLQLDVGGVENQIGEVLIQIRTARAESANSASKEYTKIVGELQEISDQRVAAKAAVDGSIVRSPVAGILTRLSATTVGGVVGAGDMIGEIVPQGADLVVQARVLPSDIDYVQPGQDAEIVVTAFNRRIDDTLKGEVVYKSADADKDEKTGDPYFIVRLKLAGTAGKGRNRLNDVQAGMQSEVYIHTGSRTFMTYLVKPMIDSFRRAFREQ